MEQTADGAMWVGTYGGLYRFDGKNFTLLDLPVARSIKSLYVDTDNRLWVGTNDAGVSLMNIDMTYLTVDVDSGLPSNVVNDILADSGGRYYFGTSGGLAIAEYSSAPGTA